MAITVPNRLDAIAKRIEAGEPIDSDFIRRLATLQAIDIVAAGEEFARQAIQRQEELDNAIGDIIRAAGHQPPIQ